MGFENTIKSKFIISFVAIYTTIAPICLISSPVLPPINEFKKAFSEYETDGSDSFSQKWKQLPSNTSNDLYKKDAVLIFLEKEAGEKNRYALELLFDIKNYSDGYISSWIDQIMSDISKKYPVFFLSIYKSHYKPLRYDWINLRNLGPDYVDVPDNIRRSELQKRYLRIAEVENPELQDVKNDLIQKEYKDFLKKSGFWVRVKNKIKLLGKRVKMPL